MTPSRRVPAPIQTLLLFILPSLILSCGHDKTSEAYTDAPDSLSHAETNAVYYWKTVFSADSAERAFISRHKVGRIYLRMFDVIENSNAPAGEDRSVPNATVRFPDTDFPLTADSTPVEIVPVVYITVDALESMRENPGEAADKIVTRVRNMAEYNSLPNVSELQLDCDWTTSTETLFFALCDSVRSRIKALELPWELSSTIRLHQLARPAPPVDRGVLMVYNTGNYNDPDAANSIIDASDVTPYLRHLPSYLLHLDVAYPTYSWQLLFRNREFAGLLNDVAVADTALFTPRGPGRYIARREIPYRGRMIRPADMIRVEKSDPAEVIKVKHLFDRHLADRPHSNIIYHLDTRNLSAYSDNEIDAIYSAAAR